MTVKDGVDDRDMIERLLLGDPDAVALAGSWVDEVLRQQFQKLRDEWDDLRQETLRRVYQNLRHGHFEGRSTLHTYVYRVTMNVAIDMSRRAYRRKETPGGKRDRIPTSSDKGNSSEQAVVDGDLVRRLLQGLPEGDRLLLRLVYGDHQSYAEAARVLGTTEGAVKARMGRCKARIVSLYQELEES